MMLRGPIGESLLNRVLIPASDVDPQLAAYSSSFDEIRKPFNLDRKQLATKTIVDFGCGYGRAALEAARLGAGLVIGIDIRDEVLEQARKEALHDDLKNCIFLNAFKDCVRDFYGIADIVMSIDAFEHYGNPEACLEEMARFLNPDGRVYISFGPPWWHPYGAHLQFMTRLPWPHLIFAEPLLLKARSNYKQDGAQRFEEVEGGLNRMSIRKFERIVERSSFYIAMLKLVPIRRTGVLQRYVPAGRELFTSVVKAILAPRSSEGQWRPGL
jgi:SAM-dependent methyltransferase